MRNFRRLFWGQGQFLTPQHFQQQDSYHDTLLLNTTRALQHFLWGVDRLDIREEALENKQIDITGCELITPEGVYLRAGSDIDQPNARLQPRSFEGLYDPAKGAFSVYLGLTKALSGQDNLSRDNALYNPGQIERRYGLTVVDQEDLFDRENLETPITFLDYHLALYFDQDPAFAASRNSIDFIKIAELQPGGKDGTVQLAKSYIPPCLSIKGSRVLIAMIKNIRDLLAGKGQEFGAFVRNRGLRATSSGAQDVLRVVMLQTFNRYTPLLQHIIETQTYHPEPVYAILRELVGELSVFTEDYTVFGAPRQGKADDNLPAYDHNNLWLCYLKAWNCIRDIITAMTSGPELGINLEYDGKEYYRATIGADFFEGQLPRYYLMIDSGVKGQELLARLQNTGKASCIEEMPLLRRSAVFGLKLDYLPVPPEELPQKSGRYAYFAIDTRSKQWEGIRNNRNIAIFSDLPPDDTLMKLIKVESR